MTEKGSLIQISNLEWRKWSETEHAEGLDKFLQAWAVPRVIPNHNRLVTIELNHVLVTQGASVGILKATEWLVL